MKTKIIIEIETPDAKDLAVSHEDNYDEKKESEYKEEYSKDLHNYALNHVKCFLKNDFEEDFMDGLEELSIGNWDNMEDYGVIIREISE